MSAAFEYPCALENIDHRWQSPTRPSLLGLRYCRSARVRPRWEDHCSKLCSAAFVVAAGLRCLSTPVRTLRSPHPRPDCQVPRNRRSARIWTFRRPDLLRTEQARHLLFARSQGDDAPSVGWFIVHRSVRL